MILWHAASLTSIQFICAIALERKKACKNELIWIRHRCDYSRSRPLCGCSIQEKWLSSDNVTTSRANLKLCISCQPHKSWGITSFGEKPLSISKPELSCIRHFVQDGFINLSCHALKKKIFIFFKQHIHAYKHTHWSLSLSVLAQQLQNDNQQGTVIMDGWIDMVAHKWCAGAHEHSKLNIVLPFKSVTLRLRTGIMQFSLLAQALQP